jgi:hypothetical protein
MEFHAYQHLCRPMPLTNNNERHVSFITPNRSITGISYKCELCEDVGMTEKELNNHCGRNPHISRVSQIRQMQQNQSVVQCAALQPRIDELGLRAWQSEVESKLYWTLLNHGAIDRTLATQRMVEAEALIQKYEGMERIALLELAIWKAVCIVNPDSTIARNDYHFWQEWAREGWKCSKSTMRKANAIAIIMTAVLPFLADEN